MIKVLEKNVADKIAAGEVIDRPVSIVKELVENSLDAGAGSVTVEIKNGGKSYIRVTDNGCGIEESDVSEAFKRHATSKISKVEDLDDISTLGFRGEALASICAVSRVEMITRPAGRRMGTRVVIEESRLIDKGATGCPEGTTITVRDLFYNLPARLKFLASDASETRKITDMLSRMALSYPDVRINLISGGKNVFTTSGRGNILNSIISIYGAEIGSFLLPVSASADNMVLKGFISNPGHTMSTRSRQIFCVNGRVVSSDVMRNALEKGYRERLMHGRFPVAFLFLSVPGNTIDVNIHPAKKEVRFDDRFKVEDFISQAVSNVLKGDRGVTSFETIGSPKAFAKPEAKAETKTEPPVETKAEQVDIKEMLSSFRAASQPDVKPCEIKEDKTTYNVPFDFDSLSVTGAVFNTYILAQNESDFFMIDQHAAHERIFYEKIRSQYNSEEKLSQKLLIPVNISVSSDTAAAEENWMPAVLAMGYGLEFFGNNTYLLREIPAFMELSDGEAFLKDFISSIEDKPDPTDYKTIDRIIVRSCKSAVKGGDRLSTEEAVSLINQLKLCDNPFSCPHGRPTFIKFTKYDIEKMFKRV